jgi:hypothetical protein
VRRMDAISRVAPFAFVALIVSGLVLLAVSVASASRNDPPEVRFYTSFTLAPGQGVRVARAFLLRLDGVLSDSRCPINALCVQPGTAVIKVLGFSKDGLTRTALYTNPKDGPNQVCIFGRTVRLVSVSPAQNGTPIPPRPYRATFVVNARCDTK